ncbi:MAG: hypothetical protein H6935_11865 [Thiobacillus sp.]|nr:hypothetical protein [Thiobacillus sp.]
MTSLSVERQIAVLRPTLGYAAHMHTGFLVAAAVGLIAALVFWHPVPLMLAAFLAVVGFSEQRAGPNIVAAISAYDAGTPTHGEVFVTITCWDTDNHYHATVSEPGHSNWLFEFVPQGWQPASQLYPARIWRCGESGSPTLVVVEEGILIPRYDPKPV